MKQEFFVKYAGRLLSIYKEINGKQYHCEKNYCCGLCDRFYTCLIDICDRVKEQAIIKRKNKKII